MQKQIPILFSTPMVRAIMEGKKTMTRRQLSDRNSVCTEKLKDLNFDDVVLDGINSQCQYLKVHHAPDDTRHRVFSRISEGDILWVRETWCDYNDGYSEEYAHLRAPEPHILFKADCTQFEGAKIWRPSIFMPKSICRIWLEVTRIRVERLQNISNQDAKSEGVHGVEWSASDYGGMPNYKAPFKELWQQINGNWQENPFVWVIEFKVLSTTGQPETLNSKH